jgi:hypothetical protein
MKILAFIILSHFFFQEEVSVREFFFPQKDIQIINYTHHRDLNECSFYTSVPVNLLTVGNNIAMHTKTPTDYLYLVIHCAPVFKASHE